MPTIREEKTELRHREWAEQIQECQSSGMTVTAWCKEKGIGQHTYDSCLNVVRKELLKRAELSLQQIVPLSVSQSVTCTTATVQTQCITSGVEPEKVEPAVPQKVIVRKDGIEVEMPPDISEELLLKSADASTLFMSVIETAKRNGLNVFGYLSYLMLVLPSWGKTPSKEQLDSSMPWSAALRETCHRTYHQIVENMAEVK